MQVLSGSDFIFQQLLADRQGFNFHFYFWPVKDSTFACLGSITACFYCFIHLNQAVRVLKLDYKPLIINNLKGYSSF